MAHQMAFPFLYINLSGEMMYIIEQRLEAQNIETEKAAKVLNDVLSTMLNRKFVSDMFQPGPIWNPAAVKSLMEKIVHASIMRLGHQSFEKLYDLMVMAFKYQLFSATCPQLLMDITLKHLENLRPMTDDPEIILQIHYLQSLVTSHYGKLSPWTWMSIRHVLLNYLQDCRTRVSIFLKKQLQNDSGHFYLDLTLPLPPWVEMPSFVSSDGRKAPYQFEIKTADEVQCFGSNLFNEPKKFRRPGPLPTLDKLFISQKEPADKAVVPETAQPTDPSVDCETLELTLPVNLSVREEPIQLDQEETLLDLLDQLTP